jgi:hypothetical protein
MSIPRGNQINIRPPNILPFVLSKLTITPVLKKIPAKVAGFATDSPVNHMSKSHNRRPILTYWIIASTTQFPLCYKSFNYQVIPIIPPRQDENYGQINNLKHTIANFPVRVNNIY